MFKCYTFPVGDVPSNDSWSGFQMVNEQANKGYLLLFRELHNNETEKEISLKFLTNKRIRITNLEDGKVLQQKVNVNGGVVFSLPNRASYLFFQYELLK
jgi:hypothetical protein